MNENLRVYSQTFNQIKKSVCIHACAHTHTLHSVPSVFSTESEVKNSDLNGLSVVWQSYNYYISQLTNSANHTLNHLQY